MGIDYRAAVFVGLPRGEIQNQDLIDDDELEVCPPYYDGNGARHAIAGFEYKGSDTYAATEFEWDQAKVDELKAEFKTLTGQMAKVYISPYGY
jgi:hypothetical protein